MKKLVNTLLDLLFIIGVISLAVSLVRWYNRLSPGKQRLYWHLFLAYLLLLLLIGIY